ncbi:MAG: pyridoxamine kinase [Clostridia bacterium]|nr:pyridoxamine kinase [Clostridia bacterium]
MKKQLPPPRIAAVHDLSCVGRCALTVIIPTLSVMGYQTVPVPTALLSTHTGGFTDLHFRDLTDDMHGVSDHFERLGMSFRAIYTGFLGSDRQIRTVEEFIGRFGDVPDESGRKPLILVDPVMGDDGELYSTYTPSLVEGIRQLSRHAHVLTPNLTEACILTDTLYRDTKVMRPEETEQFVQMLLGRLGTLYSARTVITGIVTSDGCVVNAGIGEDGRIFKVERGQLGISYPGTGDIFASVLLGGLLVGKDLYESCAVAADFVGELIDASTKIDTPVRMGVALEPHLGKLIK